MITREDWVAIRNLKQKQPRLGTRTIARMLGISRNTVRRALASDDPPAYHRREAVNPALVPFEEFIREAYLVRKLRVSRILADLRSMGFQGSRAMLYRYIRKHLKPEREQMARRTFQPYEAGPGEQMLFDWSSYNVWLGGELVRVYVHGLVLGFSRKKVFTASLGIAQAQVFAGMEECFHELGGVCERIQVDNARVFVRNASSDPAMFQWNPRFLAFCGYYGIRPTRSKPRSPWSKGKVEKPFDHLNAHLIQGSRFPSLEGFLNLLRQYNEQVNDTVHSVTRKTPNELFAEELPALLSGPRDGEVHPRGHRHRDVRLPGGQVPRLLRRARRLRRRLHAGLRDGVPGAGRLRLLRRAARRGRAGAGRRRPSQRPEWPCCCFPWRTK